MKLISILVIFLFISLCDSDTLTFYEENLTPNQIISYSDNSVVIQLAERLNNTCNVPSLTFRVLYPNGTNNLVTLLFSRNTNKLLILIYLFFKKDQIYFYLCKRKKTYRRSGI